MLYRFKAKINTSQVNVNLDGDILADSVDSATAKITRALANQFKVSASNVHVTAISLLRKTS